MKNITEKTVIPLSLVLVIIAAMYIYHKDMSELTDRLSRVEGKLGIFYAVQK